MPMDDRTHAASHVVFGEHLGNGESRFLLEIVHAGVAEARLVGLARRPSVLQFPEVRLDPRTVLALLALVEEVDHRPRLVVAGEAEFLVPLRLCEGR